VSDLMSELSIDPNPRPLGATSLFVSNLAYGMWRFAGTDVKASRAKIDAALSIGINLFDTADIYGPDNGEPFGAAEALLGRVFAEDKSLRARMVLATKGGISMGVPYDSSARYLTQAVEDSLRRMGVDVIDLYQIHRPDILTHPQALAETLARLREQGKIRAVGVSNHTAAQTSALQAYLPFALASHQPEFSALALGPLGDGVMDQAMERAMAVLAWSPLGQGRLGGTGDDARTRAVIAALDKIAMAQGVPRTAVALSWIMAHPAKPIPIIGSQTPSRIVEAAHAQKVHWTRTTWYEVLVASRGEKLP
jgi:predicted oxidoreductase